MAKLSLAHGAVGQSKSEDAIGHPYEPAAMSGGEKRGPVAAEREQQPRSAGRQWGQAPSAQEVRETQSRTIKRKGVLQLLAEVGREQETVPQDVARNELAGRKELPQGLRPAVRIRHRVDNHVVRHDRRDVKRPRPPKDESRECREDRGKAEEPKVLLFNLHILILYHNHPCL